ncbi:pheromone processing endoprotease [Clydaea vesicula]|uniref:Pheromone processing endoprotease n=1 Tax=Clydaea vesicula TaxID=447962 RepID=A0AAD5U7D5_9FUNG|nr:pheromone processing endoprotease [Clydaea vesicula]
MIVSGSKKSYIQNHLENNLKIGLNDHQNFYYFVIKTQQDPTILSIENSNFHYLGQVGELENHYLIATQKEDSNAEQVLEVEKNHRTILKKRLSDLIEFEELNQQLPRKLFKRKMINEVNNDCLRKKNVLEARAIPKMNPIFQGQLGIRDPEFQKQWHLVNLESIGNDINITTPWAEGITGQNATVCFIDDGLDYDHPDLKSNFYAQGSYDFNDHRALPKPKLSDDRHGTRCAGEVAAIRNDVCGVGVAWNSKVSGIRILSGDLTEADEATAITFDYHNNHIYSCSWGPSDNGQAMDAPPKLVADAFYNGIIKGRDGKGSLYIFATGNGGSLGDNCNFDGYTNSIYTITVGAIDRYNNHPSYSEECSAQMVVTYSSGAGSHIHTSDWPAACTETHGGTSAAAPLASGIYALVVGIRPDFTWRDFQYVSVNTALPINLQDSGWAKVAKNRLFNHKYGYGKLDAYRLVEFSKTFKLVNPQVSFRTPDVIVDTALPHNGEGIKSTFLLTQKHLDGINFLNLEHITVTVWITHGKRGDVQAILTSPNNYTSILATRRPYDTNMGGFQNWTFMTVKHWDENPVGSWELHIFDSIGSEKVGRFNSWSMTFFGQSKGEPVLESTAAVVAPSSSATTSSSSTVRTTTILSSTASKSISFTTSTSQILEQTSNTHATAIPSSSAGGTGALLFFGFLGFAGVILLALYIMKKKKNFQDNRREFYNFEKVDDDGDEMLNAFGLDEENESDVLFERGSSVEISRADD